MQTLCRNKSRLLQKAVGQLTASLGGKLTCPTSLCLPQSPGGTPCVTPDPEAGRKAVQYLLTVQSSSRRERADREHKSSVRPPSCSWPNLAPAVPAPVFSGGS